MGVKPFNGEKDKPVFKGTTLKKLEAMGSIDDFYAHFMSGPASDNPAKGRMGMNTGDVIISYDLT